MANKIIQMKDKYKSTNKEFPYIIGDCFTDDADEHVKKIADKEIEDNVDAVVANPELAGTEADLEGIQIGDTKYKIGGGKKLYQHNITINYQTLWCKFTIINDVATAMTFGDISQYLIDKGLNLNDRTLVATGHFLDNNVHKTIIGIFNSSAYTDRIYPSMLDSSGNESHANYMSSGASLFDTVIAL